jgi:GABA permease
VIGALVTMTVEGTYRAEVLSTSCLAAVIVIMGLIAQRYGIGKGKAHTTKNSWVC